MSLDLSSEQSSSFSTPSVSSERRVPCQNPTWSCGERASRPNRILPESSDLFLMSSAIDRQSWAAAFSTRRVELRWTDLTTPPLPQPRRVIIDKAASVICSLAFNASPLSSKPATRSMATYEDVMLRRQRPLEPHNRRHWVPRRVSNQHQSGAFAPEPAWKCRGRPASAVSMDGKFRMPSRLDTAITPHAIEPAGEEGRPFHQLPCRSRVTSRPHPHFTGLFKSWLIIYVVH